ncbi:unnamed protein product, partial [Staurois parvus]
HWPPLSVLHPSLPIPPLVLHPLSANPSTGLHSVSSTPLCQSLHCPPLTQCIKFKNTNHSIQSHPQHAPS